MRRHRDRTGRLSWNWNPRKKKARVSWSGLYLAAVLEPALSWCWRGRRAGAWPGLGKRASQQPHLPPFPVDALPRPTANGKEGTGECPALTPQADPHRDAGRVRLSSLGTLPGEPSCWFHIFSGACTTSLGESHQFFEVRRSEWL